MAKEDLYTLTKHGREIPAPITENMITGSGTFVLVAATQRTIAVPAGAVVALFSPEVGNNFYWSLDGVAAVPAADDDGATPSLLNPVLENVAKQEGSTISVISASAMNVTVRFF